MTERDVEGFAAVMVGMAENFGQSLTETGIELRFEALKAYSLADIKTAAMDILANRKYTSMPTVADFIERLRGDVEDTAEVEAGKVLEAVAGKGGYRSVVFDDATTQAVIHAAYGGWPNLCENLGTEGESVKWWRKDFVKIWAAYRRQGVERFGALPGRTEIANRAGPFAAWTEPPALIGSPRKALAILERGADDEDGVLTPADTVAKPTASALPGAEGTWH